MKIPSDLESSTPPPELASVLRVVEVQHIDWLANRQPTFQMAAYEGVRLQQRSVEDICAKGAQGPIDSPFAAAGTTEVRRSLGERAGTVFCEMVMETGGFRTWVLIGSLEGRTVYLVFYFAISDTDEYERTMASVLESMEFERTEVGDPCQSKEGLCADDATMLYCQDGRWVQRVCSETCRDNGMLGSSEGCVWWEPRREVICLCDEPPPER